MVACTPLCWYHFGLDGPAAVSPESHLEALLDVARDGMKTGHVVAIGECGLDFDRLQHCTRDVQMRYFELQFKLAEETQLPMFLHSRATSGAMVDMLKANRSRFTTGVVHSFDGDAEEAAAIVALDLYIGTLQIVCSICCVLGDLQS